MLPDAQRRLGRARDDGDAVVIYLRATPDALKRRLTAESGDRPPLRGGNGVEEVDIVLREREATYLQLSDEVIDADQPVPMVVDSIVTSLRRR